MSEAGGHILGVSPFRHRRGAPEEVYCVGLQRCVEAAEGPFVVRTDGVLPAVGVEDELAC